MTVAPLVQKTSASTNPGNQSQNKQSVRARLATACQGKIQPVELQLGYRLGLMAVAIVFVLLVSFYFFAFTALTLTMLSLVIGAFWSTVQLQLLALVYYIPMIIVGGSVWLAMIKPLLSEPREAFQAFDLNPQQEPVFFEYVQLICRAVDAPEPYRISVDLSPNASASLISGWWDSRLRLTVGLPLILALNTRQLAGVVAHEFAHFRQRSGMRWTNVIRSLNQWFARIVFERDAWDEFLQSKADAGGLLSIPVKVAQMVVAVVRYGFMGLFFVSHFLTSNMLRQMEFDADRCEARLAGSQVFAQTSRRMRLLCVCEEAAGIDMNRFNSENKLVDNLPALIVANVDRIPKDKFQELERAMLNAKTEWHDSHPADRERIDNIAREQAPGIFGLEIPSASLLGDSGGICRALTLDHYRREFGADFDASRVHTTASLVHQRKSETGEMEAAQRFFFDQIHGMSTLEFPRYQLGAAIDPNQFRVRCQQYREQLQRQSGAYTMGAQRENQIQDQLKELEIAKRWMEALDFVPPGTCSLTVANLQHAIVQQRQLELKLQAAREQLLPFRKFQGQRLLEALEMLQIPSIAAAVKVEPADIRQISDILNVWGAFHRQREFLRRFYWDWETLKNIVEAAGNDIPLSEGLIRSAVERVQHHFAVFPNLTPSLNYPFQHAKGSISISQYLILQVPAAGDLEAIMLAGSTITDNLGYMLTRCLCRLACLAERVENHQKVDHS
ncbi:MAG: M48 family metalloprotease [Pirellulaceae bacterium]